MSKDTDTNRVVDPNQDGMIQPPPPSYTTNNPSTSFQPPEGPPPNTFYQAQPIPGQQTYAPPLGAPPQGAYMAPSPSGYAGGAPPQGGNPNTVVYVVDGNDSYGDQTRSRGIPIAMLCFIAGICTWLGYIFGMCFITSKDPRERFWARCCTIAAMIYSLIIIFAAIFGRH
ncbi:hypothetical protein BGX24_001717 [Mortierella sp. AD032]|nr:hypothetical protein BGX24_001717 [Mortierella sp. AD032]